MEFWEGAVLLVGGIWLVGRVHRNQVRMIATSAPVSLPSRKVPGPTSETNTDGSGYLVGGETLSTGTGPQPINSGSCPSCTSGGLPILSRPTSVTRAPTNFRSAGAIARPYVRQPLAVQF